MHILSASSITNAVYILTFGYWCCIAYKLVFLYSS